MLEAVLVREFLHGFAGGGDRVSLVERHMLHGIDDDEVPRLLRVRKIDGDEVFLYNLVERPGLIAFKREGGKNRQDRQDHAQHQFLHDILTNYP